MSSLNFIMLDKIPNYRLKIWMLLQTNNVLHICGYYFPVKRKSEWWHIDTHTDTHTEDKCADLTKIEMERMGNEMRIFSSPSLMLMKLWVWSSSDFKEEQNSSRVFTAMMSHPARIGVGEVLWVYRKQRSAEERSRRQKQKGITDLASSNPWLLN